MRNFMHVNSNVANRSSLPDLLSYSDLKIECHLYRAQNLDFTIFRNLDQENLIKRSSAVKCYSEHTET